MKLWSSTAQHLPHYNNMGHEAGSFSYNAAAQLQPRDALGESTSSFPWWVQQEFRPWQFRMGLFHRRGAVQKIVHTDNSLYVHLRGYKVCFSAREHAHVCLRALVFVLSLRFQIWWIVVIYFFGVPVLPQGLWSYTFPRKPLINHQRVEHVAHSCLGVLGWVITAKRFSR